MPHRPDFLGFCPPLLCSSFLCVVEVAIGLDVCAGWGGWTDGSYLVRGAAGDALIMISQSV